MFINNMNKKELSDYISDILSKSKSIKKNDSEFKQWFNLTKENIYLLKDSLLVIDPNFKDSYDISDEIIYGSPLYNIISYEDINDIDSKHVVLEVKLPFDLETKYDRTIEEVSKYSVFFIEGNNTLFTNNLILQSVDNAYGVIKELFDGKFNMLRQLNYEEIPDILRELMEKNKIKNFQYLIYELMTLALCRDINDFSKEFRFSCNEKNPYDKFKMINIRDISRNYSAFDALASENISKSLISALIQSKNENRNNEVLTPQEQIALKKF